MSGGDAAVVSVLQFNLHILSNSSPNGNGFKTRKQTNKQKKSKVNPEPKYGRMT